MRNTTPNEHSKKSNLELARALELPSREAMLRRAPTVVQFWSDNKQLLLNAWHEWEKLASKKFIKLDDSLIDPNLRDAVEAAWQDSTKETSVEKLWTEVSPSVYEGQLFNPERLSGLRDYLNAIQGAGIPLRPPYGIALNRFGLMLDERSEGFLATPEFQSFYGKLHDKYMRPIARLLFPEITGYDTQKFGFSIQYEPDIDTSLERHSDASSVTLNVNLNLPGESFSGSEVDFYDPDTGKPNRLTFKPGTAMIHRGNVVHEAQAITSGMRTNFVLWLYGDRMQVPYGNGNAIKTSPAERWKVPIEAKDRFAPF